MNTFLNAGEMFINMRALSRHIVIRMILIKLILHHSSEIGGIGIVRRVFRNTLLNIMKSGRAIENMSLVFLLTFRFQMLYEIILRKFMLPNSNIRLNVNNLVNLVRNSPYRMSNEKGITWFRSAQ